jgi:hypothetical protein
VPDGHAASRIVYFYLKDTETTVYVILEHSSMMLMSTSFRAWNLTSDESTGAVPGMRPLTGMAKAVSTVVAARSAT